MITSPDFRSRIIQILSDVSAVPAGDIKDSDLLGADLNMDSVASMELLGMLDEEFGIEIELEEAASIENVSAIIALAAEHLHVH